MGCDVAFPHAGWRSLAGFAPPGRLRGRAGLPESGLSGGAQQMESRREERSGGRKPSGDCIQSRLADWRKGQEAEVQKDLEVRRSCGIQSSDISSGSEIHEEP